MKMHFICNIFVIFISMICTCVFADIAIIVHKDNSVDVTSADVSNIFLGKINSFADGERALPLVLKRGNPVRKEFITKVLSRSEAQYKAYWSRLIFTGRATPPIELSSNSDVINKVSENRNAIAFIDASDVSDHIRVVQVY